MMSSIIIWSFITYGLTTILVYGSIFSEIREWIVKKSYFFGTLITCVLCTSTWVGFMMSFIVGGFSNNHLTIPNIYLVHFLDGMLTAGLVWSINSVIEFFEENRFNKETNQEETNQEEIEDEE